MDWVNARIPAQIIQTGRSQTLPLQAKAAAASCRCLNPEFEYLFFDDDAVRAFVASEFPQYLATFEAFPYPIQQIDFFRYLAVFRLGGFYFDLDVFLAQNLSPLREHGCVFPFEELTLSTFLRRKHGMDWEIGNYAFGAAAGHPFLDAVIRNCVRAQQEPQWVRPMLGNIPRPFRRDFEVLNTTGPGLVSRTLAEHAELAEDVAILFPEDVCDERNWHQFGDFGVHVQEGSWRPAGSYVRRRSSNRWESWVRGRLLIESRRLGPRRGMSSICNAETSSQIGSR